MTPAHAHLIEGVYRHRLVDHAATVVDDPTSSMPDRSFAAEALATCADIERRLRKEEAELVELLAAAGVSCAVDAAPVDRQYHTIRITVDDVAAAEQAATTLSVLGFSAWEPLSGAARRSLIHFGSQLTMAKTEDVTTVVRIAWARDQRRSALARVFTPTAGDWAMLRLPTFAWRLYSLVRPFRLVAERLGLRRRHADSLGPFLSTPDSLLAKLLEFADVDENDTVVDLGCGDGRIVVAAAERSRCRGIGVETAPDLVRQARSRAENAGVSGLVTIEQADARDVDLGEASVVFMFLPIDVVADIIEATLDRMPGGSVLVVHEQSRLPSGFPCAPQQSTVLLGAGVTVAHRFEA